MPCFFVFNEMEIDVINTLFNKSKLVAINDYLTKTKYINSVRTINYIKI